MMQQYPIQLITLDKVAHQALELAGVTKFAQIDQTEMSRLSSTMIADYHHIVVLSALSDEGVQYLLEALGQAEDPIVVLPDTLRETEEMKQLLLGGIRVVLSPTDTLVAVSLSQTLERVESLFYADNTEMEIEVDHKDIYVVIPQSTISEFYESVGTDVRTTAVRALNRPKSFDDVAGAYVLYTIHEDHPIVEVVESMEIIEEKLHEEANVIFGTRNTPVHRESVKVTCMVSRYFDFKHSVQEEIETCDTYLQKIAVIVDAFARGEIAGDEADLLAERNNLSLLDLKAIYNVAYEQQTQTVTLMKMMQDENISDTRKVEAVADVLIDESVDTDIAEEIAKMKRLSIDEIRSIVHLKREGKLPLQDIEIPSGLRDKYPNLTLAKSADTTVLIYRDQLKKEDNGVQTVETDELKSYEKDGVEWFVSKKLDQKELDLFATAYGQL